MKVPYYFKFALEGVARSGEIWEIAFKCDRGAQFRGPQAENAIGVVYSEGQPISPVLEK